jgi:hypothetical protein
LASWVCIAHFDMSKFSIFEKDYFILKNYYCVLTLDEIVVDSFLCETPYFFPNIYIMFCSLLRIQETPLEVPRFSLHKVAYCHIIVILL